MVKVGISLDSGVYTWNDVSAEVTITKKNVNNSDNDSDLNDNSSNNTNNGTDGGNQDSAE